MAKPSTMRARHPRPAVSSVNATSVQDALLKSWDEIDRAAWAELLLLNDLASPTTVKRGAQLSCAWCDIMRKKKSENGGAYFKNQKVNY
ncbi:hypothetical protein HED54_03660 [Ochrobactrum anthropi ATCC 49188]|nr:hypothetical protein [Brucella anthropi ATCC 49188]